MFAITFTRHSRRDLNVRVALSVVLYYILNAFFFDGEFAVFVLGLIFLDYRRQANAIRSLGLLEPTNVEQIRITVLAIREPYYMVIDALGNLAQSVFLNQKIA
jgi:hypothetical protein